MAVEKPIPNQKLRYERERRAWSQQDVADQVGTTPLNVGRWERGVTVPGPHFRLRLCEVFEKTAQELGLVVENIVVEQAGEVPLSIPTIPYSQEAPPLLWNIPYNRNLLFTGREDILAQLYDAFLNGEQPVALTQPQAISGLGGIGKTQTAVEYAYRYRDQYEAVFWARADSTELLSSDFLIMAALLNLPQYDEQDQSLVVKAVLNWFDTHERWLLILDNADDLGMVSAFLPSAGRGHVLLTTRAHSTGTIAGRIEVETMGLEEGKFLLLRRAKLLKGSPSSMRTVPEAIRSQAQAIVEAVDGLPLALDQAGAYIEGTGCSLSDYLKFYKTRRHRLLRMRGGSAVGHPEPVATTWSLSFEKVERANPAAAELLRLCAFLHPDEIPESMIVEGASEVGSLLQPVAEDEMELNEAIGELRKYSLVKRDPEKKILNIHRLVQAVVRDGMDKELQETWAERVVRMVNKAFPEVELATREKCQQYSVHAQECARFIVQWHLAFPEAAHLLQKEGNYLVERTRYNEAEQLLVQALSMREQIQERVYPDIAQSLQDLAVLYQIQGRYDEAESLYQRTLTMREQILGRLHPTIADSLYGLAVIYWMQGKYQQAEILYLRTLSIYEQLQGSNGSDVANSLNSLALLYQAQGKYEQAELFFQRSLAISERTLGTDHPDVALCLNNIGWFYYRQGRYDLVETLHLRALAIWDQTIEPGHPHRALSLAGLGVLYRTQGKYDIAESLLKQALAIQEQALKPEHPYIALSLGDLAILYSKQDKYTQAELLFQRALTIQEQSLVSEHPDIALTLENYATLLRKTGRESEAAAMEERIQAIRAKQEQGT